MAMLASTPPRTDHPARGWYFAPKGALPSRRNFQPRNSMLVEMRRRGDHPSEALAAVTAWPHPRTADERHAIAVLTRWLAIFGEAS